jgi:hypothetical protein
MDDVSSTPVESNPITQTENSLEADPTTEPFVGRWNTLVSTTNWEKGRIICQWREALVVDGVPAADYSDERWCVLVGGVTGQHVGRLRRVYKRFGDVFEQYDGLYWSHFHAALDWDDAEMWLEGGVQNRWSVSQMRRKRWETLGEKGEKPSDDDVVKGELDEDFEPALKQDPVAKTISGTYEEVSGGPRHEGPDFGDQDESPSSRSEQTGASIYSETGEEKTIEFVRPFENLAQLPDDLSDAFEAFKLAVLRHKSDEWSQVSRDDVLASLDALKELVLAPSAGDAAF